MNLGWAVTVSALYLVWAPFTYVRRLHARSGSYERYVWNTVERILRWPAALIVPYSLASIRVFDEPDWYTYVICGMGSALCGIGYVMAWRQMRADDRPDDDDWFNRTGRRVTRWLKLRRTRARATATA